MVLRYGAFLMPACIFMSNACMTSVRVCLAFSTSARTCRTTASMRRHQNTPSSFLSTSRLCMSSNAAELHTGYEWLAREKIDAYHDDMVQTSNENGSEHVMTGDIIWMDIESGTTGKSIDTRSKKRKAGEAGDSDIVLNADESGDDACMLQLPLYPLGAVHLPSPGQIHTLNNIEPRNIKMANDLIDPDTGFGGRFCVALRASDTGRIAQTATLMRVINTTKQESFDGNLLAVRVECVAEGLVEVRRILNPQAWSKEQRIKKSEEYLIAKVCVMDQDQVSVTEASEIEALAKQVEIDFATVHSTYSSKDAISTNELPTWAVDAVRSNLPVLTASDFANDFWRSADIWQQLTNTIRMARRSELNSDVNEITIDEACKLGGPLKLPVHRSDLPIDVQKRLNKMEEDAAQDFIALGMDSIISFQIILSMRNDIDRLRYLASLISLERRRLQAKSTLRQVFEICADQDTKWSGSTLNSNVTSFFD